MSCIFVFTIAAIFARDSRQQYRFMQKCNSTLVQFHAKYPLFDSQSDRDFTLSYAILGEVTHTLADM